MQVKINLSILFLLIITLSTSRAETSANDKLGFVKENTKFELLKETTIKNKLIANKAVVQSVDINNDFVKSDFPVVNAVDLGIGEFFYAYTPVALHENFSMSADLVNRGNTDAINVEVQYYLSADNIITNSDIYIGSSFVNLPAGDGVRVGPSINPLSSAIGISPGDYYTGIIIPSQNYTSWSNSSFVEVLSACIDDIYENDDVCSRATAIAVGSSQTHDLCNHDWVSFTPIVGAKYRVETFDLVGGADTALTIQKDCGNLNFPGASRLDNDDIEPGNLASRIEFTADTTDSIDILTEKNILYLWSVSKIVLHYQILQYQVLVRSMKIHQLRTQLQPFLAMEVTNRT